MKGIRTFAFAATGLLVAASALAQPQRPQRHEQGGMMDRCGEMMKQGGMMDGVMGRGDRPNERWRKGKGEK